MSTFPPCSRPGMVRAASAATRLKSSLPSFSVPRQAPCGSGSSAACTCLDQTGLAVQDLSMCDGWSSCKGGHCCAAPSGEKAGTRDKPLSVHPSKHAGVSRELPGLHLCCVHQHKSLTAVPLRRWQQHKSTPSRLLQRKPDGRPGTRYGNQRQLNAPCWQVMLGVLQGLYKQDSSHRATHHAAM